MEFFAPRTPHESARETISTRLDLFFPSVALSRCKTPYILDICSPARFVGGAGGEHDNTNDSEKNSINKWEHPYWHIIIRLISFTFIHS